MTTATNHKNNLNRSTVQEVLLQSHSCTTKHRFPQWPFLCCGSPPKTQKIAWGATRGVFFGSLTHLLELWSMLLDQGIKVPAGSNCSRVLSPSSAWFREPWQVYLVLARLVVAAGRWTSRSGGSRDWGRSVGIFMQGRTRHPSKSKCRGVLPLDWVLMLQTLPLRAW